MTSGDWAETYRRVSAAKQYPVIASIDQVVVNGAHAEDPMSPLMAFDPQVRSTPQPRPTISRRW